MDQKKQIIENAWDNVSNISSTDTEIVSTVGQVISALDSGEVRVAEKKDSQWIVNEWVKKAVLISFRINDNQMIKGPYTSWFDKVDGKTTKWNDDNWAEAGFRMVPNGVVRKGSYIGKNCVLMPSFINIGAYVDEGTMVDTWSTVGSCAQIGKNCHLSGGVGIGGVLEPLQANPVIIEDNCFVGARSEVAEGVIVREGSVLSMGVYLGASTKVINRETGKIIYGEIPPYSVVVPGNLPNKDPSKPSLYCAVIVKTVDEQTRSKTSINDLLRE